MYYYKQLDGEEIAFITSFPKPSSQKELIEITEEEFISLGGKSILNTQPQDKVFELQEENQLLKAQVQAMENQYQFLEDCIAEMAAQVY